MSYIKNEEYTLERQRPKLLTNYLEHMKKYLHLKHPNVSLDIIDGFIKDQIKAHFKSLK